MKHDADAWVAKLKEEYSDYQDLFLAYSAAMFAVQPIETLLENILEGLRKGGSLEFTDKNGTGSRYSKANLHLVN